MDMLMECKGVPARQRRAHARPSGGTGSELGALEHTIPTVDCELCSGLRGGKNWYRRLGWWRCFPGVPGSTGV